MRFFFILRFECYLESFQIHCVCIKTCNKIVISFWNSANLQSLRQNFPDYLFAAIQYNNIWLAFVHFTQYLKKEQDFKQSIAIGGLNDFMPE